VTVPCVYGKWSVSDSDGEISGRRSRWFKAGRFDSEGLGSWLNIRNNMINVRCKEGACSMRKHKMLIVCVLAVGILSLLVSFPSFCQTSHRSSQGHCWEYATLTDDRFFSGDRSKPAESGVKFWCSSSGDALQGGEWDKLYELLGGEHRKNPSLYGVLEQIGRRGWELVDYSIVTRVRRGSTENPPDTCETTEWIFKRPCS